jgi:hypothetical protein
MFQKNNISLGHENTSANHIPKDYILPVLHRPHWGFDWMALVVCPGILAWNIIDWWGYPTHKGKQKS